MQSGSLKEKISFYRKEVKTSEYGDTKISYEKYKDTSAQVEYNTGSREVINSEITYPVTRTFHVRFYHEIEESMRILYQGKYYQITSIEPIRSRNEKIILADLVDD